MRLNADTPDAGAVLNRALDLGANLLDTADIYGGGTSEKVVGVTVRRRRDDALLCTKFGVVHSREGMTTRGDAAYVRAACDASLTRLGIDVIDLYYLHDRDPNVPIEETVGAMADLVTVGKVRHLGLSNVTADELRAAHAVHRIAALQSEWSLISRDIEDIVGVCADLGVAVVPYCPQGAGQLNRLTTANRRPHARNAAPVRPELLESLDAIARRHGARPGQIALAWVHQRETVWGVSVAPIPGTTRVAHVAENVAALEIELHPAELSQLDRAAG